MKLQYHHFISIALGHMVHAHGRVLMVEVTETIKEGVTVFSLTENKKAGIHLQPGDRSELAFTRAMFLNAVNIGHHHQDHVHNDSGLCGAISQIAAAIGAGGGS